MKKVLTVFFVTLGVIFFILILGGVYFFVADPLELRPLLFGAPSETETAAPAGDRNPALSEEQERALDTVGIDPASVPSEFTDEQVQCFEAILGAERVSEIKAGASPTPTEYFKARGCL